MARQALILSLFVAILAGCAGTGRVSYEGPQDAHERGMEAFENRKFERAAEYFQGVFDFGRTHEWAADAQLMLARSYRSNRDYLLAANEFTRFTQIYRADPRVPDAAYELAMTYFDRSPAYRLDQSDTERAIDQFELFISRYGDNPLVSDAESRITELRAKLAHKRFEAAGQYERRRYFEAAAITYSSVFDDYYDTSWADDALLGAIRAYMSYADESIAARQPERLGLAIEQYERLIQIFPGSEVLKDAERLYIQASQKLEALNSGSSTSM